jgi:hypothetical protein
MPGNFSLINRIALVDSHGNVHGYFDGSNPITAAAAVVEKINRLQE